MKQQESSCNNSLLKFVDRELYQNELKIEGFQHFLNNRHNQLSELQNYLLEELQSLEYGKQKYIEAKQSTSQIAKKISSFSGMHKQFRKYLDYVLKQMQSYFIQIVKDIEKQYAHALNKKQKTINSLLQRIQDMNLQKNIEQRYKNPIQHSSSQQKYMCRQKSQIKSMTFLQKHHQKMRQLEQKSPSKQYLLKNNSILLTPKKSPTNKVMAQIKPNIQNQPATFLRKNFIKAKIEKIKKTNHINR